MTYFGLYIILAVDLAIAQSEVWSQRNTQLIAKSKRKEQLHFLANLWSQSEFMI